MTEKRPTVCAVLSGTQFRGPYSPGVQDEFPCVSTVGRRLRIGRTLHINLLRDPLGTGSDGQPVYLLVDIRPTTDEITEVIAGSVALRNVQKDYADVARR